MFRRPGLILLALFLVACSAQRGEADLLQRARQHIEASYCAGVNRYAQAITDLRAVLDANPDRLEAYYWLYVAHSAQGDTAEAERSLASLETAVAAGRGGPEGAFWLFRTYAQKGDTAGADRILGVLESTARSLSSDADAQFWLGRAYAEQGRSGEALQFFQKALAINPHYPQAQFWVGQIYAERGLWEEARAAFDAALKEDPNNIAALHNRAVGAYRLGDLEQATADLQDVLKREPDDPRSHYQLGAVYLARALPKTSLGLPDTELLKKARSEFDAALTACPGMPEALIGLGNLYLVEGNPQAALDTLQQAVERSPDSAEVWFALAQTYATLDRNQDACNALDHFLSLSPPQEWADQAVEMRTQFGCP